jgi:hypothetical protein
MAYNTDELYKQALQEIEENTLFFVSDVVAYLGIAESTFYEHFPPDSEKSKAIKEKLNKNAMRTKVSIRSKLHQSKSPTGLLALYKLLATNDERKALAMEYREHSGEVKLPKLEVVYGNVPNGDESKGSSKPPKK